MKNETQEVFMLPNNKEFTEDPAIAADEWAKAFYKAKDALSMIRKVPEAIINKKVVRNLDEILLEIDKVLELGE